MRSAEILRAIDVRFTGAPELGQVPTDRLGLQILRRQITEPAIPLFSNEEQSIV